MLIFLRVALPSRILVVMSDEALFPFVPCGWAVGVMIVLMSLTLPTLASF